MKFIPVILVFLIIGAILLSLEKEKDNPKDYIISGSVFVSLGLFGCLILLVKGPL